MRDTSAVCFGPLSDYDTVHARNHIVLREDCVLDAGPSLLREKPHRKEVSSSYGVVLLG